MKSPITFTGLPLAALLAASALPAWGQTIVIMATRIEERRFEVPAAVDVVDGEVLRDQQLRVNLSETLARVPGLVLQNRQNYAQDLQVSSRGFGARSTFGVRGVRLLQDGIPITMPDGQGQTASIDLDGAQRIEVLRGPFAALYGNASGGVIHVFGGDGARPPVVELSAHGGAFDSRRLALRFSGAGEALAYSGNVARFRTGGYRDHSAAERDTANVRLRWKVGEATSITLIGNRLDQPETQDPLGLTQAQYDANRRQAGANAVAFNTRKRIDHSQGGLALQHRLDDASSIDARLYGGQRRVIQYLALPLVAQGITSSGGVVDLDRDFGGASLEWRRRGTIGGAGYTLTAGVSRDRMSELRRGYVSLSGVRGDLRRDETDVSTSDDQYLIGNWQATPQLKLAGGVRHSSVRFRSDDRFVTGANPDDSGRARYAATLPVLGFSFGAAPGVNVFASIGRGFETPTFAELAYRSDGQPGLNFGLDAARSTHVEAGVRLLLPRDVAVTVAAFRSSTRDEVVAATSSGGRNTFTNAEWTRRQGVEMSLDAPLGEQFAAALSYTLTDARFERFVTTNGTDLSGRSLPGVPRHNLFGEITWRDKSTGLSAALELRAAGRVAANDANTAHAARYGVVNVRAGWGGAMGPWRVGAFVRIDNTGDKKYVGSVIVNEANQRYFEPALPRAATLGASASLAF